MMYFIFLSPVVTVIGVLKAYIMYLMKMKSYPPCLSTAIP